MGWTGRALAHNGFRWGASKHGERIAMSQGTDTGVISTIGIDTGKNTLHLVGLDDQGTIVLRERNLSQGVK
jgi:hypothetical protein